MPHAFAISMATEVASKNKTILVKLFSNKTFFSVLIYFPIRHPAINSNILK